MRLYQSSNRVPFFGWVMMGIGVLFAAAVGALVFYISNQYDSYVTIVFPLLMGIAGAYILEKAVRIGRVRNRNFALVVGFLAGVAMIAVWRVADYEIGFRSNLAQEARLRYGISVTQGEIEKAVNDAFEAQTGWRGIVGYNLYTAHQRQPINLLGTVMYLPINEYLLWAIWIIEWLIILTMCTLSAGFAADDPFNEQSQRWYVNWRGGRWMPFAHVSWDREGQVLDLLKRGDFQSAGQLMTTSELALPYAEIEVAGDASDGSDWLLRMRKAEVKGKSVKREQLLLGLLSPAEFALLRKALPDARPVNELSVLQESN